MSRSFKKTAGGKDRNPYMKNYANRVVRRMSTDEEAPQYKGYRKINNPWDICDYKFLYYSNKQVQDHLEWCTMMDEKYGCDYSKRTYRMWSK